MGCFETKAFPGVGCYGISDVIASVSPINYRFSDHNLHNFDLELPTFSPNFWMRSLAYSVHTLCRRA